MVIVNVFFMIIVLTESILISSVNVIKQPRIKPFRHFGRVFCRLENAPVCIYDSHVRSVKLY